MTIATSRSPAARDRGWRSVPAVSYDRARWRESAACRHVDPELFFPIGSAGSAAAEIRQAKAVCASCPVRRPCLTFALATSQEYGIWGGYDEDQRRPLRRQWRESGTATASGQDAAGAAPRAGRPHSDQVRQAATEPDRVAGSFEELRHRPG